MRTRTIAAVLAAGVLGAAAAQAQDLGRQSRRLEEELRLAKTSSVYLVVDSGAGTLSLKTRGMVLKTWRAARMNSWGRPIGIAAFNIAQRSGWSAQDRVNVTPGKKKEPKADAPKPKDIGDDVLELVDMPTKYRFILGNGVRLTIRPRPRGIFGRLGYAIGGLGRSAGRSVRLIGAAASGKGFSEMRIIVRDPKDAQAIFWAAPEQTAILFY